MKLHKILWIIIFNFIIILSEILFGIISNSFALISDALHNAGDIISLIVTYITITLANTYSTNRSANIQNKAILFNTSFLYITMIYMIYEAIEKLFIPQIIEAKYMIFVGFIALIANGISAYILHSMQISTCSHQHHTHEHDNVKSAYLHMLSDALISVGVVIGGIFIYMYKIYYIDSILTIIFSIYIIIHTYSLFKKSIIYFIKDKNV
jgi:cobalt-zinc-cadmium efflux system protein